MAKSGTFASWGKRLRSCRPKVGRDGCVGTRQPLVTASVWKDDGAQCWDKAAPKGWPDLGTPEFFPVTLGISRAATDNLWGFEGKKVKFSQLLWGVSHKCIGMVEEAISHAKVLPDARAEVSYRAVGGSVCL